MRHAEIVELVSALVTDRVLSKLVEAFLNAVGLRCDDVAGTILPNCQKAEGNDDCLHFLKG